MSIVLKLVKKTPFKVEGVDHVVYVAGYKGRVFTVNTLHFEVENIEVDDTAKTLKIKVDVEVIKTTYMDLDEVKQGLALKPKMDLTVGDF